MRHGYGSREGREIVRAAKPADFAKEVAGIVWKHYAGAAFESVEEALGSPLSEREKRWIKFGADAFVRAAVMDLIGGSIELQPPVNRAGPSGSFRLEGSR